MSIVLAIANPNAALSPLTLPLVSGVKAGFPSPATDYQEESIDLNRYVVHNREATFFARIDGNSMEPLLHHNDLIVVDRSLSPQNGDIALCYIDGEFTCKTISRVHEELYLVAANADYPPIRIDPDNNFLVWGVVTYSISSHRKHL